MSVLLPGRSVLCVSGPDAAKFLQGLLSCDVLRAAASAVAACGSPPSPTSPAGEAVAARPCALLTAPGRLLCDATLRAHAAAPSGGAPAGSFFTVEVASPDAAPAQAHLRRHLLRARAAVADDSAAWDAAWSPAPGFRGDGAGAQAWRWADDPRTPLLGARALLPRAAAAAAATAGGGPAAVMVGGDGGYAWRRLWLGVLEGGAELGGCLPHETNADLLHLLDFGKGCYLGQEPTARTQHRGVVRKRALPLHPPHQQEPLQPGGAVARGDAVLDAATGAEVGRVLTVAPAGGAWGGAGGVGEAGGGGGEAAHGGTVATAAVVALLRLGPALRQPRPRLVTVSGAQLGSAEPPGWWPPGVAEAAVAVDAREGGGPTS